MKCPECGTGDQTGKFCAKCGAALGASCPSCEAELEPGARFCPECGEAVAGKRRSGGRAAWIIAAAAVAVVALVLFLPGRTDRAGPRQMTDPAATTGAPFGGPGAGEAGMGGLSNDMRTNADRLFNRIMTAAEQGNQAQVDQFMPMAVQAYGMVDGLDDDGIYHLAILHLTAGEHEQAIQTAQRILDGSPNHILALGVAANAAEAAGDAATASSLYERLLESYNEEAGKPLPEYVDHQRMLEEYRRMAEEHGG